MSSNAVPTVRLRRPPKLNEWLQPPGSKSLTNRALLLAALARGRCRLRGVLVAEDSRRMRSCLERLGVWVIEVDESTFDVEGRCGTFAAPSGSGPLFAGSAGTVGRFLTAVLAAAPGNTDTAIEVDAAPQMRERPMGQLLDALRQQGAGIRCLGEDGRLPVEISAGSQLRGGEVVFSRPASSQLISAMVLAANFSQQPTRLVLREGTPSRPYVDMTLRVLEHFGGCARWDAENENEIAIEPRVLAAREYLVEPDASSASYFLGLAAIHGGDVAIAGLGTGSAQGDTRFCEVLERMGASVDQTSESTRVRGVGRLAGIDINLTDMPDMSLTLAVAALFAEGPTTIRGVEILRHHETDRLAAAAAELRKLGATVEELTDGFHIEPPPNGPKSGVGIDTYDDHRMAMAFSMVGDVEIRNPGCVAKTFPGYFDRLAKLGMVR
ncbi:MAG: 3-phosphoshikimate 1-carboxyvinyltransferase [Myxococcota bacterium]